MILGFFHRPDLFDRFVAQFDSVLPFILDYYHYDNSVKKSITDRINEFYFQNSLTKHKKENITNVSRSNGNDSFTFIRSLFNLNENFQMIGDEWYLSPVDSYLRMRLSYRNVAPTYHYLLTHKTPATYSKIFGDPDNYYGIEKILINGK